jgi:hypothetical protein
MSLWFYRKGKEEDPSIFSVTIPFEVLIIILTFLAALLVPRYMFNAKQLGADSIYIALFGFILFLISKLSLFAKGIWNSWGSKPMKKPFGWIYRCGYILIIIGFLGVFISI